MMEPFDHFNVAVRHIQSYTTYLLSQLPAEYLARIDKTRFAAAFSMVDEEARKAAEP